MIWKNLVNRLAITSGRRGLATAVVYGLSLAVRFTSAAGEEMEIPAQSVQATRPVISITTRFGSTAALPGLDRELARPTALRHSWLPSSGDCRAACEFPLPISYPPGCASR
jgi:hypothetical protein